MAILLPFRGQVWLITLDPTKGHEQAGTRPCLVVSVNKFNHSRAELVVIVPVTTTDKRIPSHVKIAKGEAGLTEDSYAMTEAIRCISRDRLIKPFGTVEAETLAAVEERLRIILGL